MAGFVKPTKVSGNVNYRYTVRAGIGAEDIKVIARKKGYLPEVINTTASPP